jgi:hypothetical protein
LRVNITHEGRGCMKKSSTERLLNFFLLLVTVSASAAVVNYALIINNKDSTIRDPTYREMLNFIALDQTDKNTFIEENYTCLNFAVDVKNNAFLKGYKCGLVYIVFTSSAHTIVCFNTTDQGLIYIEPQNDAIVKPIAGQPYWDRTRYNPPLYNDTIIYVAIVWNTNIVFFYH